MFFFCDIIMYMKKVFEGILVLIIFYGVYSAFEKIAPVFIPELKIFWVIIIALIVAAALLLLYSSIIASGTKRKVTAKMTSAIEELKTRVQEKEKEVAQKDSELKDAFKVKKAVEDEAEKAL